MGCHVPFVRGVMGTEAPESPGYTTADAVSGIAKILFPEAPLSGIYLLLGYLSNTLRISELAAYEFDVSVFDTLLDLLNSLSNSDVCASQGSTLRQLASPVSATGRFVGRVPASLSEFTHVPLLPSVFGEEERIEFSRFRDPNEAEQAARACGGFVGTDPCVAVLSYGGLVQALSTELFTFRRQTNVANAYPLTPVIVWFLQHGGEDTSALSDYVAEWFSRPRHWRRSSRLCTRTEWRWFCSLVARAFEDYGIDADAAWRMLGLFLLDPPPVRASSKPSLNPVYCISGAAVLALSLGDDAYVLEPSPAPWRNKELSAGSDGLAPLIPGRILARQHEDGLWKAILDRSNPSLAVAVLVGLYRRQKDRRAVPRAISVACGKLPPKTRVMTGVLCRCPGRKSVAPTADDMKMCDQDHKMATYVARARTCSGTCERAFRQDRCNMPSLSAPRSHANGPAFNKSCLTLPLNSVDILAASVAPRAVWDEDPDTVIVPVVLWDALVRNEYRVHGLDVNLTAQLVPPLATWRNQGTGVSFRNDMIPHLPLWKTEGKEKRTTMLSDLCPAALPDGIVRPVAPSVRIVPLASQRLCICQVFDQEDYDPRRSARFLAARGLEGGEAACRPMYENEISAADAWRMEHHGTLPKLRDVVWPVRPG